jgi:hemin uptake protein HemP
VKTGGRDPDAQSTISVISPGLRQKLGESAALYQGQREIVIVHLRTEYRLHITKGDSSSVTRCW